MCWMTPFTSISWPIIPYIFSFCPSPQDHRVSDLQRAEDLHGDEQQVVWWPHCLLQSGETEVSMTHSFYVCVGPCVTVTTRGGNRGLLCHVVDDICSIICHFVSMYHLGHLLNMDHIMIALNHDPVSNSTQASGRHQEANLKEQFIKHCQSRVGEFSVGLESGRC